MVEILIVSFTFRFLRKFKNLLETIFCQRNNNSTEMQSSLQTLDYLVFFFYFIVVSVYGWWIYNKKRQAETSSADYFLAEGSLTWWAIGASLIASNISAEQFIGMSGNGFKLGLAISTYEWMAAATLMIVAIFFMPIYLDAIHASCRCAMTCVTFFASSFQCAIHMCIVSITSKQWLKVLLY